MTDNEIILQSSEKQLNVACDATDATKFVLDDASVIKALECCSKDDIDCEQCPANGLCDTDDYCVTGAILDLIIRLKAQNKEFDEKIVMQMGLIEFQKPKIEKLEKIEHFATKTIERQSEEIERLQHKIKSCNSVNAELKAEIERYKGVIKLLEKDVATAKSEAIKEFAERLEDVSAERLLSEGYSENKLVNVVEYVDVITLVKEMTDNNE